MPRFAAMSVPVALRFFASGAHSTHEPPSTGRTSRGARVGSAPRVDDWVTFFQLSASRYIERSTCGGLALERSVRQRRCWGAGVARNCRRRRAGRRTPAPGDPLRRVDATCREPRNERGTPARPAWPIRSGLAARVTRRAGARGQPSHGLTSRATADATMTRALAPIMPAVRSALAAAPVRDGPSPRPSASAPRTLRWPGSADRPIRRRCSGLGPASGT